MRKTIFITLSLFALLVVGIYIYVELYGSPLKERKRINQVTEYIEEEVQSDIQNLTAEYDRSRGDYRMLVIYENEPELTYEYLVDKEDEHVILLRIFRPSEGVEIDRVQSGKNGSVDDVIDE